MGHNCQYRRDIILSKSDLKDIAEIKHLSIQNAEKDYLLEIILYTISNIRRLLVFKGGTALYKFYNLNRFSEDLDFDIIAKRFNVSKFINDTKRNLELIGMKRTLSDLKEYSNEINIKFTIRGPLYDGRKESMSRVTINLSKREQPKKIDEKLLIGRYPEIPSFSLCILDAKEIAAEKVRCILTREKPRDVYDIWFLFKKGISIDIKTINMKLKIHRFEFNLDKFHEKLYEKNKMWELDLRDLIPGDLPDFNSIATDIKKWSYDWK